MNPTGFVHEAAIICPDCAAELPVPFFDRDADKEIHSTDDMFAVFSTEETNGEEYCDLCHAFIPTAPLTITTEIHTWFERDRSHVELRAARTQRTIIEWWDEEVQEAIEDGFLNPKDYHSSAKEYAKTLGLLYA